MGNFQWCKFNIEDFSLDTDSGQLHVWSCCSRNIVHTNSILIIINIHKFLHWTNSLCYSRDLVHTNGILSNVNKLFHGTMMLGPIPRIDVMHCDISQTSQPKKIRRLNFKWLISTPRIMPKKHLNPMSHLKTHKRLENLQALSFQDFKLYLLGTLYSWSQVLNRGSKVSLVDFVDKIMQESW